MRGGDGIQLPIFRNSSSVGVRGLVRSECVMVQGIFLVFTQTFTSSSSWFVAQGDNLTSVTSAFRSMRRRLHSWTHLWRGFNSSNGSRWAKLFRSYWRLPPPMGSHPSNRPPNSPPFPNLRPFLYT